MERVALSVNGRSYNLQIEPYESLNHVLRERLDLTGTKKGCETGGCGSCTVVVSGKAVYSCMMYALQAVGKKVLTVEGLQSEQALNPLQRAFVENGGLQCGYCTPGFIMSAYALLQGNDEPTDSEIRDALIGNLCRCTGYVKIHKSVKAASEMKRRESELATV
jgi:carbon-monoxide dehydrogenase small subunit